MEKKNVYRVWFKVQFYCGGIVSWSEGHTTVLALSEDEARKNFKEIIRIGKAEWNELQDALEITKVLLIQNFVDE